MLAMPRSMTKKPKATPRARRIGSVVNEYSNYLAILVADGPVAAEYRGPSDDDAKSKRAKPDDFDRARKAVNKKEFSIGKKKGVVVEIGGCGVADVYRVDDAIVVPETYLDEDDVGLEAARDNVVVTHPTTKPKLIGTVDVKSGVLVLIGLLEPGPKLDPAKVAKSGVVKTKSGAGIAVKPGRYDVWREAFPKTPAGDWGTMPSRVRVVPAGTKVVAGAPIVALAPPPAAHEATSGGPRRLVDPKDKWLAVGSLVVADDGRTFAGEEGGYGVAAWDAAGELLWQRAVRPSGKKHYTKAVSLALAGKELLALCKSSEIVVLDAKTGKEKRRWKADRVRHLALAGDRLILRTDITTTVLSYPGFKKLAELDAYVNRSGIAVSRDGKYLAVHGHDWHTFDLKTLKHLRTVELRDDPCDVAFTHDGKLVTVDEKSRIRIWHPRSGARLADIDGAKERSRKPNGDAVATSARHVAIAREDGAVAVFDLATKRRTHLFEKHLVTIPETGATQLSDLAFTKDGRTLWVSAGPKKAPVGLTAYAIA